ncbi:hypothetical protein GCM10027422_34410 [Hymenobacter arcticus]
MLLALIEWKSLSQSKSSTEHIIAASLRLPVIPHTIYSTLIVTVRLAIQVALAILFILVIKDDTAAQEVLL